MWIKPHNLLMRPIFIGQHTLPTVEFSFFRFVIFTVATVCLGILFRSVLPEIQHSLYPSLAHNFLFSVPIEELVFRILLLALLLRFFSPVTALVIGSLLFGAAHLPINIGFAMLASIYGVVYGLTYFRYGFLGAILIHAYTNFIMRGFK